MRVYVLLDRSGSMGNQWDDTLGAINSYAKGLDGNTNIYIAAFDSGYNGDLSYTVLRNTTVNAFEPITRNEASPRGGTPLLDASAKLLDHAFSEKPDAAYIVFMTDGFENTSKKYTKDVIKEKLARAEDKNWEVVFLGANFDNVTEQAKSIGLDFSKSYNISTNNLRDEMVNLASATMAYATVGARTVFTDDDRMRATKK